MPLTKTIEDVTQTAGTKKKRRSQLMMIAKCVDSYNRLAPEGEGAEDVNAGLYTCQSISFVLCARASENQKIL